MNIKKDIRPITIEHGEVINYGSVYARYCDLSLGESAERFDGELSDLETILVEVEECEPSITRVTPDFVELVAVDETTTFDTVTISIDGITKTYTVEFT